MLPLLGEDDEKALAAAHEALAGFAPRFESAIAQGLRAKIGLTAEQEGDDALAQDLLARMAQYKADFTLTFRGLCDAAADSGDDAAVRALFTDAAAYDAWATPWRQRLAQEPGEPETRKAAMRAVNPAFIPRNHRVEAALQAAVERQDLGPFEELLDVVTRPYDERSDLARYKAPPGPEQRVYQTFCGT
jgi:uncharacterized protein YdiU (UPF0061 family)